MNKLFSLFLALSLLFLTACNIAPSTDTTASGSSSSSTDPNASSDGSSNTPSNGHPAENWQDALKDQVVGKTTTNLIELPSRVVFEAILNYQQYTYYFSKADEKAYVYCFDPICNHTNDNCLANPGNILSGWRFYSTCFINNRFYCATACGQIWSFAFDGSDKKIEYDAGYDTENIYSDIWSFDITYGPYIYISSEADKSGNLHLLRYNVETKEMEDLTEKTGNYFSPQYIFNGTMYGIGDYFKTGNTRFKADLDINTVEIDENPVYASVYSGNLAIGSLLSEESNNSGNLEEIGIKICDMKTGDQIKIFRETLGIESFGIIAATDQYIYFYNPTILDLGTVIVNRGGKEVEQIVQKLNDGKIYRMNLDGTNIVCVYDNPDYEINRNAVFYEDRVVMQGQYVAIENGKKKVWGGPLQVAVINEDGTFGEFREVEVVG